MKKLLFVLVVGLLISSCAMHSGYMLNSASLQTDNFTYIKRNAKGVAQATYIFGFGGLNRTTLVNDAKNDLLNTYPLKDNTALVNTTVNWKQTFVLPFYIETKCIVTADIVRFGNTEGNFNTSKDLYNETELIETDLIEILDEKKETYDFLTEKDVEIGTLLYFENWNGTKYIHSVVTEKLSENKFLLRFKKNNGAYEITRLDSYYLYYLNKKGEYISLKNE